jgi:hypothetical protein
MYFQLGLQLRDPVTNSEISELHRLVGGASLIFVILKFQNWSQDPVIVSLIESKLDWITISQ